GADHRDPGEEEGAVGLGWWGRLRGRGLLALAEIRSTGAGGGGSSRPRSLVCPAWALTWRWKVLRGLGHRDPREPQGDAREGGAEGSGERTDGPTNRNRIRGDTDQGERASDRETLVTKDRRRKSGGRGGTVSVLIGGDLASRLKGRRSD